MNHYKYKKNRLDKVISSWSSFAFLFFFFYIIGDIVANWWHNAWWVFFILGCSLLGALSSTIKFIAIRPEEVSQYTEEQNNVNSIINDNSKIGSFNESNSFYEKPIIENNNDNNNTRYCKNCGSAIGKDDKYCANCGEAT